MNQKYSYGDCYKALLVKPGCSWEELRKAYKLQIKKWHPDRFAVSSSEKIIAEEKVKNITAAYKQLFEYHLKYGDLPKPIFVEKHNIITPHYESSISSTSPHVSENLQDNKSKSANNHYYRLRFLIITIIICFFTYATFTQNSDEHTYTISEHTPQTNSNKALLQNTNKEELQVKHQNSNPQDLPDNFRTPLDSLQTKPPLEEKNGKNDYFTYGSTIGEVISIQGTPNRVDGDTWYYGESEVYFLDGVVLNWKRMSGSPLKAKINMKNTNSENTSK